MAKAADAISAVTHTGRHDEIGGLLGTPPVTTGEATGIAEIPGSMMTPGGAVPCTSSSTMSTAVELYRTARSAWLEQLRSEHGSEEDFETARMQPTWTELDTESTSLADAGPSPAELELLPTKNQRHFQRLSKRGERPTQSYLTALGRSSLTFGDLVGEAPFFTDFGGRLEAGRKIGGGGQAEIYEALFDGKHTEYVLKVFRCDSSLADLQRQWVTQIGRSYHEWKGLAPVSLASCFVRNGTLFKDGRFAFLLWRYWGDLRKAIDLQIVKDKTHQSPPFHLP